MSATKLVTSANVRKQALQTHYASAGGMSRRRTGRAKLLATIVLVGILWLWLGSGTGNLQPAAHHFVRVDGTQVAVMHISRMFYHHHAMTR